MIAIQKIGKSFMGALNYNIKKGNHPDVDKRAVLLATNFTVLSPERIKAEVDLIRVLRPNLNRYVYHTSLNFSKEEIQPLTNEKLIAIAEDYLKANGFTNNQYLIFRHYDADHPHLHLLVNRIGFDGKVVSDSNNYKRSEETVRAIELKYNLLTVEPSNKATRKAPKAGEIEMAIRKGKPSDKMALQTKLDKLLKEQKFITGLIRAGEAQGIYFLFNQASTGRVSGITYFTNDFKIKGQTLGNRFKWAELAKELNYEQIRDSAAISGANQRTKEKYGEISESAEQSNNRSAEQGNTTIQQHGYRDHQLYTSGSGGLEDQRSQPTGIGTAGTGDGANKTGINTANQDADYNGNDFHHDQHGSIDSPGRIEITDDVDDEAVHGRSRHRKSQPRTNRR